MPRRSSNARTLPASLLAFGALVWTFWLLQLMVRHGFGPAALDEPVLRFVVAHRTASLTRVMRSVSLLATMPGVLLVAGLVVAMVPLAARRLAAVTLGIAALGSSVISSTLKVLIDRPRPPATDAVARFSGFSFPSGHVTTAMTMATVSAFLLIAHQDHRRPSRVIAVAALGVLAVAASRVYLGAHWLSDTLGGIAAGGAWSVLVIACQRAIDLAGHGRMRSSP